MAVERTKGSDRGTIKYAISSVTLAAKSIIDYDRSNAVVVAATSSSTIESVGGVTTVATTTADTEVLCQKIVDADEYVFDTTNNSDADDNLQRMALTDASTVNNSGSDQSDDTGIIMQLRTFGAASDKKIVGVFVRSNDRAA